MDNEMAAPDAPEINDKPAGVLLRGTPVAPGVVLGRAHRKDYDLLKAHPQRVPLEGVEEELNRFHRALSDSRAQLEQLKHRLKGEVPEGDARILDTHIAYLRDSVFLSDVENLILNEQMSLQAAIGKVVSDFDRIFRLVENEALRERAVDLRDVGIRVLRNLERQEAGPEDEPDAPPAVDGAYVLVARELSIVDMFNLAGESVNGIVTQGGGLTSHAAILARSMRIPTVTGIPDLMEHVGEGELLIVDAAEGTVRVNPDSVLCEQFRGAEKPAAVSLAGADLPHETADGVPVELAAVCGNLPEVEQAVELGLSDIALYRTELLYLVDRERPGVDALSAHYRAVVDRAGGQVTFRLLHADSSLGVSWLHGKREQNPALGQAGIRALLAREHVLGDQLQAILRAGAGREVRIALPFVIDCGELRRVKERLFEERYALRKEGVEFSEDVPLGVVIETPAAALGVRDLAAEADFLVLSLDSLQQHLLAADRENVELRHHFETVHPVVLRVVQDVVEEARAAKVPLCVFGVTATQATSLTFLVGAGVRSLGVAPVSCSEVLSGLGKIDSESAQGEAELYCRAPCAAETETLVDRYRLGWS